MRNSTILALIAISAGSALWALRTTQSSDPNAAAPDFRAKAVKGAKKPSESGWLQRTFPHYQADATAVADMIREAQELRAAPQRLSGDYGAWEFAGPSNIGGRISDIEFDPTDSQVAYAGAATGGVFKSTDRGLTWSPIFDDAAALSCGDIAIDPTNTQVLYVGTGEPNGGHNNFPGGGVYKSTDGGASWTLKGLEASASIGRVVVDPTDPDRVFVAAVGSYFGPTPDRGLYLSEDGGETWDQSFFVSDSTGCIDVMLNPTNPDVVYAAMWERVRQPEWVHLYGPSGGVFRSTDGGGSWSELTNGLPDPNVEQIGRIGLAMHQSDPNIVFALYNDGSFYEGLYRSNDGGDSWTDIDPDKELDEAAAGFSWYFGQVRVHPTDPDIVYMLDVAYCRSTNGGDTWPIIYGYGGPGILHVDHHALAFAPDDPSYLLEGNDGGINISTDGGANWTKVADLPITQFYEIGLDAQRPERIYGGTQDNGTMRTPSGATDDWDVIYGGDGFYVSVNHQDYREIYAESQNGFLGKTTNDGVSWAYGVLDGISQNEPTNWSTPVIMDPVDPDVLYYGTDRVYRTTNGAGDWTAISDDLTDGNPGTRLGTVTHIAVAPTNTALIWAGTDDSHVWITTDTGVTWSDVSASLPRRWVTRIAVDPADDQIAYVTFSGLKWQDPEPHIFKTTNRGIAWMDISDNLPSIPINALAIDNQDSDAIFVGTDAGAFVSTTGGGAWEILGEGLPLVSVYDLKVHATERFLIAGTHGRSMYKLVLPGGVGVGSPAAPGLPGQVRLHPNQPNPFNPSTTLTYSLPRNTEIRFAIYDAAGRKVRVLVDGMKSAGDHAVRWDGRSDAGSAVGSGRYLAVLEADGARESRSILLVK